MLVISLSEFSDSVGKKNDLNKMKTKQNIHFEKNCIYFNENTHAHMCNTHTQPPSNSTAYFGRRQLPKEMCYHMWAAGWEAEVGLWVKKEKEIKQERHLAQTKVKDQVRCEEREKARASPSRKSGREMRWRDMETRTDLVK